MIKVSDNAKKQLKELLDSIPEKNTFIRIYATSGGCAGMKFNMIVDDQKDEGDAVMFSDIFDIVVDKTSQAYTEGLEVDFSDDLISQGFSIKNPNMKGGCGCGASFTPEGEKTDGTDGTETIKKTEGCGGCSNE